MFMICMIFMMFMFSPRGQKRPDSVQDSRAPKAPRAVLELAELVRMHTHAYSRSAAAKPRSRPLSVMRVPGPQSHQSGGAQPSGCSDAQRY